MPKSQHNPAYRPIPPFLRHLRERATLTQRALGQRLRRPQSWIYNCETANRRVDVAEFAQWCRACEVDPIAALRELLEGRGASRTGSHGTAGKGAAKRR
jgi:hypothetical protein